MKLLAHDLRWKLISALAFSDYRVQELVGILNEPMNLVSYHLKQLRDCGVVSAHRSENDGRDVYYSLDLNRLQALYLRAGEALHPALAPPSAAAADWNTPKRVLFVCTHNSARSQMAEALLRQTAGNRVEVFSAGIQPGSVHPDAIQTMAARGIDIRQQRSKHVGEFTGQSFDYVITVCDRAREVCPRFPGHNIHWSFSDPAAITDENARRAAFEQTADRLTERIQHLLIVIQVQR